MATIDDELIAATTGVVFKPIPDRSKRRGS